MHLQRVAHLQLPEFTRVWRATSNGFLAAPRAGGLTYIDGLLSNASQLTTKGTVEGQPDASQSAVVFPLRDRVVCMSIDGEPIWEALHTPWHQFGCGAVAVLGQQVWTMRPGVHEGQVAVLDFNTGALIAVEDLGIEIGSATIIPCLDLDRVAVSIVNDETCASFWLSVDSTANITVHHTEEDFDVSRIDQLNNRYLARTVDCSDLAEYDFTTHARLTETSVADFGYGEHAGELVYADTGFALIVADNGFVLVDTAEMSVVGTLEAEIEPIVARLLPGPDPMTVAISDYSSGAFEIARLVG